MYSIFDYEVDFGLILANYPDQVEDVMFLLQQNMKKGPLVARVLKLFLHLHLVFTSGITFNYFIKVTQQHSKSKGFSLHA